VLAVGLVWLIVGYLGYLCGDFIHLVSVVAWCEFILGTSQRALRVIV
jgi:hypothetical protein